MLSPTQLEARRGKLTASCVACLMEGNAEKILRLWQEMIGEREPEDLSDVWVVRVGEYLEPLNLLWYEKKIGPLSRKGDVVIHSKYSWAACTLDAFDDLNQRPVEVKYYSGDEPTETVIDTYQPQLQWQMEVTRARSAAISIIVGRMRQPPIVEVVERDEVYAAELLKRGAQFMQFVRTRKPPVVLPPVPPPVNATKIADMTSNNEWANSAGIWCETRGDFERCRDAEKILKSLVAADVQKAFGHGVRITRDRAGRLSLREDQDAF